MPRLYDASKLSLDVERPLYGRVERLDGAHSEVAGSEAEDDGVAFDDGGYIDDSRSQCASCGANPVSRAGEICDSCAYAYEDAAAGQEDTTTRIHVLRVVVVNSGDEEYMIPATGEWVYPDSTETITRTNVETGAVISATEQTVTWVTPPSGRIGSFPAEVLRQEWIETTTE